jgi:hypothetical protein
MLRDDERKWYGFEMQETISRGERVLQKMSGAPPLVYFTLGALYHKIGDHKTAVTNLSHVIEHENSDESNYIYPTPELRNYVRILRKIEREPAEAPLTSAAIRALERARKNRGKILLEDSRKHIEEAGSSRKKEVIAEARPSAGVIEGVFQPETVKDDRQNTAVNAGGNGKRPIDRPLHAALDEQRSPSRNQEPDPFTNRQSISEVLHDIYDKNIQ